MTTPTTHPLQIRAGAALAYVARHAACVLVVLLLFGVNSSMAQSGNDGAAAEQLFNEARKLMEDGKHTAACAKFEASLKLDPAAGTAVNLAVCLEKIGKLASAWTRFREAEDMDKVTGNTGRQNFARKSAKALEPRLPRLIIRVPVVEEIPDIKVARNNSKVPAELYGTEVYVDPGMYRIVAVASGYQTFSKTIEAQEGKKTEIVISALTPEGEESGGNDATGTGGSVSAPPQRDKRSSSGTRRTVGVAMLLGGAASTAASIGVGYLAASAMNRVSDDGLCEMDGWLCSPEGEEAINQARTRATISTYLFGAGVALVGVGAVLYFTAPKRRKARTISLAPLGGREHFGLALSGRF